MDWELVDKKNRPVKKGAKLKTFRGEPCTLDGFEPPHSPESTGRIYVMLDGQLNAFYPSVCDLRIIRKGE